MTSPRLRWLAALLIRGRDAMFVRGDLDDMYARDRTAGRSFIRAHIRYTRRLVSSAFSLWRASHAHPGAIAEWAHDLRGGTMLQDLRFALRLFRKHPAPVGIAVGGLGLAIGVVAAVFTIVDATFLRPYAMDDPATVVGVYVNRTGHGAWSYWSYARFQEMRAGATLSHVEGTVMRTLRVGTTSSLDDATSRQVSFVSEGYMQTFGGRSALGRTLTPDDNRAGQPPVAVVSYRFWARMLGAEPGAVGKTLWLNGAPVTVVGVLRADFTGPVEASFQPAVWAPFAAYDDVHGGPSIEAVQNLDVDVVARLAPSASMQTAEDNLVAVANGSTTRWTGPRPSAAQRPVRLYSAASPMDGPEAQESYLAMAFFFGVVGIVLAVACANTANLLLAAATTRMEEIGVRLALGASTGRIVRQLVHESLLLGLIAGALGFLMAVWFVPVLASLVQLPPEFHVAPDTRVLAFTIAVAVACGLVTGLSPARYGVRGHVLSALKAQSSANRAAAPSRLRTSFVTFQTAVSMFLLVAASLLTRSAMKVAQVDVGFDIDRIVAVRVEADRKTFDETSYMQRALAAIRAVPSVEDASIALYQPFGFSGNRERVNHDGRTFDLHLNDTDADFFTTLGLRVRRGRVFSASEVAASAPVAVISESVGRTFYGGQDAIGQSLSRVPSEAGPLEHATIVGIVADALTTRLYGEGFGAVYQPIKPTRSNPANLIIRTRTPHTTALAVSRALLAIDPTVQPETSIVRERLDSFRANRQMFASLSTPLALLVVALAAFGIVGVTAFATGQRAQEMSVRVAIGASHADVMRLLVRDHVRPVLIGLGIGLGGALIASRIVASELSGISPHDPISVGIAVAILLAGALVAFIIPARRAAMADPSALLKQG